MSNFSLRYFYVNKTVPNLFGSFNITVIKSGEKVLNSILVIHRHCTSKIEKYLPLIGTSWTNEGA